MPRSYASLTLSLAALGSLCIGVAVYLFDRGGAAYFVPDVLQQALPTRSLFGWLAGSLPTFAHVFAFALLTTVVLGRQGKRALPVCLTWAAIDGSFELGQLDVARSAAGAAVPDAFSRVPLLEWTASYFTRGTFDITDVCSIALGAAAAYLLIRSLYSGESDHART